MVDPNTVCGAAERLVSTESRVLALAVGATLVACFNSSGMKSDLTESDLTELAADELTIGEADDVCRSLDAQLDRLNQPKPTCYGEALNGTDDADACEELFDSCIERNDPLRFNASGCTAAGVQSCSGMTVGDLVGCYTALADFVTDLSCATLDSDSVDSDAEVTGCVGELAQECPGLFTTTAP